MAYKLLDDMPVGMRRAISAMLATFLTFIAVRLIFNMGLDAKLMGIALISAGFSAIITFYINT